MDYVSGYDWMDCPKYLRQFVSFGKKLGRFYYFLFEVFLTNTPCLKTQLIARVFENRRRENGLMFKLKYVYQQTV